MNEQHAQATAPVTALEHAVAMGALGYHVHPVRLVLGPDGKKQFFGLPDGWNLAGLTSRSDIELVWRSVGATAYMVAPGPSGVTVVDLDVHPERTPPMDGRATWAALGGPRGAFVVGTWSGGEHHYFAGRGAGNGSGGLGVDIKGLGGGVVGPGSEIVDATGAVIGKYTVVSGHPDRALLTDEPSLPDVVRATPRMPEPTDPFFAGPPKTVSAAARQWENLHNKIVAGLRHHAAHGWGEPGHAFVIATQNELARLSPADAVTSWVAWCTEAGVPATDRDLGFLHDALRKFPADRIVPDVTAPTSTEQWVAPPAGNLPPDFWAARPVLAHIRQAAHSRACSADAVLGVLLARLASCVPGRLRVDTGVRTPTPLSTFAVLLGNSGTGKSSAAAVALAILPQGIFHTESHPLGSGEGLCDAYMTACKASEVPGGDQDAKGTVYVQTVWNAFFHADEGARVLEVGKRSGSTLLPILRDAWSGGDFGQRNTVAGGKNRKVVSATVGLWLGLQQPHAVELLSGANAVDGTIQRFVWFASADPAIPDDPGPWPGPVPMSEHFLNETQLKDISVADPIRAELRVRQVQRARGVLVPAAGREQDDALRVRLAALLALLEGRTHITEDDWALALVVLDTSAGHMDGVRALQRDDEARSEAGRIGVRLRTLDAESDHADRTFDAAVAKIVTKIVTRLAGKPEGLARRRLREAVARTKHAEFDAAIVLAEDTGLVRVVPNNDAHGERVYGV